MKLQQLRYLVEIANHGLNVSEAAEALFTSQPGVSKQVKLIEEELGVAVFERSGKRFVGVTQPGDIILGIARRILQEADNLKRVGEEYASGGSGRLALAATHTQARYTLPAVVKRFMASHPNVRLTLHQGSPMQIVEWLRSGEADIGIATEALDQYPDLVALPCFQWSHSVIVPEGHPLTREPLTLPALSRFPLITYDTAFAGRSRINRAFERAGLVPQIVLEAIDADVIKTYVSLGLGLGIIADLAFDPERDVGLVELDASHLFESNTTKVGLRRGTYLRAYEYDVVQLFAPHLTRRAVDMALAGGGDEYQL